MVDRIEAVTVCVRYSDFLAETARRNIPLLDRWVIVTEPSDEETRELCRRLNLECILSEDGRTHADRGGFNKGRLVERGMLHLSANEGSWRLHIDADIALPSRFRHALDVAELQEDTIYGFDRFMVKSWADWKRLLASGELDEQWSWHYRVAPPPGFELGSRWASPATGWVPIGFAQLFHWTAAEWRGIKQRRYPSAHGTAARSDVQFSMLWDRPKRALVPEVFVAHLESEPAPMGANWKGRTTRRFGPPGKDGAAAVERSSSRAPS